MQIVVAASDAQWTELTNNRTGVEWIRVPDDAAFALSGRRAVFQFPGEKNHHRICQPEQTGWVDSVVQTCRNSIPLRCAAHEWLAWFYATNRLGAGRQC